MKKKFNIMLCTLIGVLSACNEYDFDQEQYRNEVGLLSNSSLIYDRQVANVGQEKDTIYLVATCRKNRRQSSHGTGGNQQNPC